MLRNHSQKHRSVFWQRTRRLQDGSLACLWWHNENEEKPNIVFAAIANRHETDLAKGRPSIGVR